MPGIALLRCLAWWFYGSRSTGLWLRARNARARAPDCEAERDIALFGLWGSGQERDLCCARIETIAAMFCDDGVEQPCRAAKGRADRVRIREGRAAQAHGRGEACRGISASCLDRSSGLQGSRLPSGQDSARRALARAHARILVLALRGTSGRGLLADPVSPVGAGDALRVLQLVTLYLATRGTYGRLYFITNEWLLFSPRNILNIYIDGFNLFECFPSFLPPYFSFQLPLRGCDGNALK